MHNVLNNTEATNLCTTLQDKYYTSTASLRTNSPDNMIINNTSTSEEEQEDFKDDVSSLQNPGTTLNISPH